MQNTNEINLVPVDGELYLKRAFYPLSEADQLYHQLLEHLAWQQERLFIYGRWLSVPRLTAWYGDTDAHYRYSGVEHSPLPWIAPLDQLREDVEQICGQPFNSVLANLYRDGRDSMGCHSDNEKVLGVNPLIASLSFGETRVLRFRHLNNGRKIDLELAHGDLLLMAGTLQHHWQHELPKTRKPINPRINLTFRGILPLTD